MSTLDLLIERLQTARKWTCNLLADFEEARWFDPPAPGVGHVAWQVGHLAASQVVLVHVRCFDRTYTDHLSAAFRDQFGRGSTPVANPAAYPAISDIRAAFDRIHQEAVELISGMSPDELDSPTTGEPHPMFNTRAEAIGMAAMHESFHAGQIALIRRLAGKAPLR
ncbi:MAG TPA: DinB family protein [Phycisphaerae bacterium]|nr:DinB family protein [Phycisphaerae bacterium]